jgi:hypothetical protein
MQFNRSQSKRKLNEILAYIKQLKQNPFSGWSDAQEGAYLTACLTIEKKIADILDEE